MKRMTCARPLTDPAADDELAVALSGTPWSLRRAGGPGTRPALELYEAGSLADIIVATPFAPRTVRGARRASRGAYAVSLAWGCLPGDGHPVSVAFGGASRRPAVAADVIHVAGLAWFAIAAGRLAVVSVACHGRHERLRLRSGPLW